MQYLRIQHMSQNIQIDVTTKYLGRQDKPADSNMYVFSYTVNITNNSPSTVQLMSRYWLITNGDGEKIEVQGDGVVGEQPIIAPQETFSYTSASMLKTAVGTMEGFYAFVIPSPESATEPPVESEFKADIPAFSLAVPNSVH